MFIKVMSLRGRQEEPERTIVCWRGERKNKKRNEQLGENERDGE